MIKYIQRRYGKDLKTVDMVDSKDYPNDKPAFRLAINELLDNYSRSDTAYYYESSKPCRNWK